LGIIKSNRRGKSLNRIIDVNLNRATEALRVLEEISRFYLDNKEFSASLKNIRHELFKTVNIRYKDLLKSRDTEGDVGVDITNPSKKADIIDIYRANFKRLQQSLRVLAEYSSLEGLDTASFEKNRYDSYTLEKDMFEELSKKLKIKRLQEKKLYLVTDRSKFETTDGLLDAVASALKGGVQIVQLREKTATAQEFIQLGKKIKELCALYDAVFLINDRVDIAHIIGADGVHLGQDDIDINSARHLLGNDTIVGISTHSPEQAQKAIESGADYIGVGPVFTTPTKPGRQAVGLEYVNWAATKVNIPWFAIGGIDLNNVDQVINAGAKNIAVVRAIMNAESPEKAARAFLDKITEK